MFDVANLSGESVTEGTGGSANLTDLADVGVDGTALRRAEPYIPCSGVGGLLLAVEDGRPYPVVLSRFP